MSLSKEEYEQWEIDFNEISYHRIRGMELEKVDINLSINEYEQSIYHGEFAKSNMFSDLFHAYAYSYQRLLVLLRKIKDTDKELLYSMRYLNHDIPQKERNKLETRIVKLKMA